MAVYAVILAGAALSASQSAVQLTPQEQRGQQIYRHGTSPLGQEITALLNKDGTEVSASVLACANCHGHDGRGKPEGGVTPSNITWDALTKPYEITHPSGRKHPPYTERSLKRAITMGLDSAGHQLHVAMPRFRMVHQDVDDLIAYLKVVGKNRDPGLTDTAIRIGIILPPSERLTDMSAAVKAALTAYFDEINRAGGLYARQVELRFVEPPDSPEQRIKAVRDFIKNEQVFALTSSFLAGADHELASLVAEMEIPLVGAFTLYPQVEFPLNRYIFYLHSGLVEQGRALALGAAKRLSTTNPQTVIVYSDDKSSREVAEAIKAQCQKSGWNAVEEVVVSGGQFNAALLAQKLSERKTDMVFFLAPSPAAGIFLQQAQNFNWKPTLLIPGALVGREIFDAPVSFDGHIFLSYPILPSDQTPEGVAEYQKLAEAHKLSTQHLSSQVITLASAKVLVEGLKRAGRDVSRERLIEALEGLYEFKTGLTPAVTYGPNRRVGAWGAYIVSLDLKAKTFVPVP